VFPGGGVLGGGAGASARGGGGGVGGGVGAGGGEEGDEGDQFGVWDPMAIVTIGQISVLRVQTAWIGTA